MRVRVLADDVINKISAGEVVERPASVVRELVDNALDAGATDISVTLEDGGQRLIRVSDDGSGMERDDALLALERHATSKLSQPDDLLSIATLGFRGEALPSIAAVSKMVLRTRPESAVAATEIIIAGGKILKVQEAAAPRGSTMEVRQLFYNTPARRKFLKSARTEELKVKTWLTHASISRPQVRIRLISDGRELLNLPRHSSELERAASIFRGTTIPFEGHSESLSLVGLVGHPSLAQMESGAFVILVNGRLISDRMIVRAVKEGFDSTLKDREFPIGFVSLRLAAGDVDVNVHPQKSEVRFRHAQEVFEAVKKCVAGAVQEFCFPVRGAASFTQTPKTTSHNTSFNFQSLPAHEPRASQPFAPYAAPVAPKEPASESRSEEKEEDFRFSDLRYIGQLMECYLLTEWNEQFYIVDMHAAHERYNFNLMRRAFRERNVQSQQLLVPLSIELSEEGVERCLRQAPLFEGLGFHWDSLGPTTLVARAMPSYFREAKLVQVIKEVAALTDEFESDAAYHEQVDKIAARLACHASIRSGKEMEREEVYALFKALDSTEFSAACPHGRPVVVSFSKEDVEAWFGRDR
ncbi:MAG: DNA mismatch repair endonuclease MutL [Deltaproteobacteria bacterium]|nr:DNA mismatch repair endonuclease MutL [Deltaproteobacteria bacterium]